MMNILLFLVTSIYRETTADSGSIRINLNIETMYYSLIVIITFLGIASANEYRFDPHMKEQKHLSLMPVETIFKYLSSHNSHVNVNVLLATYLMLPVDPRLGREPARNLLQPWSSVYY